MGEGIPTRPVIGLIGGIGSGKSLVASMLGELGCDVIDADRVGHELLRRGEIVSALAERFGRDIVQPDGTADRALLGQRAFVDPQSLAELNAIMHPPLKAELVRRLEAFRCGPAPAAVLDAALLLETDWHELVDVIVFVDCPLEQRRQWLIQRNGLAAARWPEDREKMQKPLDLKRARADYVVQNNSSVSHLQRQVTLLYQHLVSSTVRP